MKTPELKQFITDTLTGLCDHTDELRDLDAALGDGDLGITVGSGSRAVIQSLADVPDDAAPAAVAKACAKAFAAANPSTMAALVAGALLAGAKVWTVAEVGFADAAAFGNAAAESIGTRGKSKVGDKTILDALVPAMDAFGAADNGRAGLQAGLDAAREGAETSRALQSQRGRASWLQERSIGLPDPGATAFVRLLEEMEKALPSG